MLYLFDLDAGNNNKQYILVHIIKIVRCFVVHVYTCTTEPCVGSI